MAVSWEEERSLYHAQKHSVSSLPAVALAKWVDEQDRIALTLQRRLLNHPRALVRCALAKHPATDPEVLSLLFETGAKRAHQALALNPQLPLTLVKELLNHSDVRVRAASAAHNPLSTEMVRTLYEHCEGPIVCVGLWRRPDVPPHLLAEVALNPCHAPALKVAAGNPSLPATARKQLIATGDIRNWRGVISNPSLTEEEQLTLLKSGDRTLGKSAVFNHSLTRAAKDYMVSHADDSVVEHLAIVQGLNAQQEQVVAKRKLPGSCRRIAATVTDGELLELFHDGKCGSAAAERAAANPRLSAERMAVSFERGGDHQMFLAGNPALPESLQEKIIKGSNLKAKARLATNPSLLAVDLAHPVSFTLLRSPEDSMPLIEQVGEEIWESVGRSWEGSFEELLLFVKEFGKE